MRLAGGSFRCRSSLCIAIATRFLIFPSAARQRPLFAPHSPERAPAAFWALSFATRRLQPLVGPPSPPRRGVWVLLTPITHPSAQPILLLPLSLARAKWPSGPCSAQGVFPLAPPALLRLSNPRDNCHQQSSWLRPDLCRAHRPTAFSRPSLPLLLFAVCAYHPTVVLLLLTVNTPWSPRNVVVPLC
jgi:hypothetical protein